MHIDGIKSYLFCFYEIIFISNECLSAINDWENNYTFSCGYSKCPTATDNVWRIILLSLPTDIRVLKNCSSWEMHFKKDAIFLFISTKVSSSQIFFLNISIASFLCFYLLPLFEILFICRWLCIDKSQRKMTQNKSEISFF